MKTLIKLSIILISFYSNAQQVLDLIVPMKTYHFEELEKYRYAKHEGGNAGLIASFTNEKSKINNVYSVGYVKNSYGNWSLLATYGKSYKANKWLRLDFNIGLATNYQEAYYATGWVDVNGKGNLGIKVEGYEKVVVLKKEMANKLNILYKNKLLPVGALTAKIKVKDFAGIAVNVNPYYVNIGLMVTLK